MLHDPAAAGSTAVEVTRQGIYYRVTEVLPPAPGGTPGGVPVPRPPGAGNTGEGAPLTSKPVAPQSRPQTIFYTRRPRMHLWYAPLKGGVRRELLPEIRALDLRVSGEYCYWVRSKLLGPGPPLEVPVGHPPVGELMVSPLSGGTAHRIALGIETLWVDSGTAFWRVVQPGRSSLVFASPPDFSLRVLDGFTGEVAPIRFGDRLYWLAGASTPDVPTLSRPHQVASSRLDGTDFHVLLDVDPQLTGQEMLSGLRSRDSDLLFYQVTAQKGARPAAYSLCRLRAGDSRPINLTPQMSNAGGAIWLDGTYAYFLRSELRENWLDWSSSGLIPRRLSVLHRVQVAD